MKTRALNLLAVFLPALTAGLSGVTPEPLRLQPFAEVDLARFVPADFGPFVTLAGVTVEDVPWVLVTAPAGHPGKQIIVPMSGKLPNRITVGADVIDKGFLAQDQAGTLYVRQQGRKSGPRHALAAYARSGALLNVRPLETLALQYAVTSAGIVAVFRDALSLMPQDGGIPRSFSLKPALSDAQPIALELPGKRLAVIDAVSGAGQVVDLVSGKQSSFLYEDEDILKSKPPIRDPAGRRVSSFVRLQRTGTDSFGSRCPASGCRRARLC